MNDLQGKKLISNIAGMIKNSLDGYDEKEVTEATLTLNFVSGQHGHGNFKVTIENITKDSTFEEIEDKFFFDDGFVYIENVMFKADELFSGFVQF